MGWIGQKDHLGGRFDGPMDAVDGAMPRGTVMVEYRHVVTDRPLNLLRFMVRDPKPAALTVRVDPCGALRLLVRCGAADAAFVIDLPQLLPGEPVVVRYGWDTRENTGVLAVTLAERDIHKVMALDAVVPLSLGAARQMMMQTAPMMTAEVTYVAISDVLEPVGPMPGLDATSRVMTPSGPRLLGQLAAGDIVIAADGAPAQVRWAGQTILPALGVYRPVVLRAPYYGVHQDMALNGNQTVHLRGSEVEYLFAETEVAVVVRDLEDDRSAVRDMEAPLVRYVHVMIDRPVALLIEGIRVPGLDPTPVLCDPVLAAHSLLSTLPRELVPRDAAVQRTSLHAFETQTLRRMRVA